MALNHSFQRERESQIGKHKIESLKQKTVLCHCTLDLVRWAFWWPPRPQQLVLRRDKHTQRHKQMNGQLFNYLSARRNPTRASSREFVHGELERGVKGSVLAWEKVPELWGERSALKGEKQRENERERKKCRGQVLGIHFLVAGDMMCQLTKLNPLLMCRKLMHTCSWEHLM